MSESSQLTISTPAVESLTTPAQRALQNCRDLVIPPGDRAVAQIASNDLMAIAAKRKTLVEQRLEITRPIDASKQKVMDLFAGPLGLLEEAEGVLRKKLGDWLKGEEERVRAEQAKVEEEQRREREKARQEAARIAAEAAAAEQRLRDQAEVARAAGKAAQAARLEAKAEGAAEEGQARVADLHSQAAALAAAPIVEPAPKLKGVSSRRRWGGECYDLDALIEYVATPEGRVWRSLLVVDQSALNGAANTQQERFSIPGCRLTDRTNVALAPNRKADP